MRSCEIISLVIDLDIENFLKFDRTNFKEFSISRSLTSDIISRDPNLSVSNKFLISSEGDIVISGTTPIDNLQRFYVVEFASFSRRSEKIVT